MTSLKKTLPNGGEAMLGNGDFVMLIRDARAMNDTELVTAIRELIDDYAVLASHFGGGELDKYKTVEEARASLPPYW